MVRVMQAATALPPFSVLEIALALMTIPAGLILNLTVTRPLPISGRNLNALS